MNLKISFWNESQLMNIFTDISQIKREVNTVVTIGTFDGIHQGHLKILNTVRELAAENSGRNFVITFDPHPRKVVGNNSKIELLTTLDEKIKIFENAGIENLLIIKFTKDFSQTSYDDFIEEIICKQIGTNHIVIGYDHKFGKGRDGNEQKLNDLGESCGFKVSVVGPVSIGSEIISSTVIRKALLNGDLDKANTFLAANYSFSGKVVEGCKRGRTLGFPTANIDVFDKDKLIPANGVYLTKVYLEDAVKFGIMNIGVRPTFENELGIVLEVHLIDFSKFIYGENLKVEFLLRIRDEKKFESKEDLIYQINEDKNEALRLIDSLVN